MASKRVLQLLTLRNSSIILRSQCAASRCFAPRAAPSQHIVHSTPQFAQRQRRWNSAASGEKSSKIYKFEDIQKLASSSQSASDSSPVIVDVREPHEYKPSHIPTAINIPISSQPDALLLSADDFEDRFGFQMPEKEREVVFYCKAGVRSRFAAEAARTAGFKQVGEYKGSWMDWVGRGGEEES